MVLSIEVPLLQAQKVKEILTKKSLLNRDYFPKKVLNFIYFPIINLNPKEIKKLEKELKLKIIKQSLTKTDKPKTLTEILKNQLSKKEIQLIPHSQEVVGSILILEIPEELTKKEKLIAQAFLQSNKSLKTVVKKTKAHEGTFRLRKVKILAGIKTKETIHKENGIQLKIDLEKTYFSTRSANERLRIAHQIKKPEEVLVMFSGAAPYPLVLAKNSPAKLIYGIEINPLAHQLALENVQLNHLENKIKIFEGDVRDLLPKTKKKFDRILMPLPKTSELFLDLALTKAKPNTIIHHYAFLEEDELPEETKRVKALCHQYKHQVKILRVVKCGQFSPYVFRVCFDIKVLK